MTARACMLAALAAVAVSGCGPGPATHAKTYFAVHDDVRKTTIAGCHDDPGQLAAEANCNNAIAAQADIDQKAFWTVTTPASRQTDPGKL